MANPIKKESIIESGLDAYFASINKELDTTIRLNSTLRAEITKLNETRRAIQVKNSKDLKDIDTLNKQINVSTETSIKLEIHAQKLSQEKLKTQKLVNAETTKATKEAQKLAKEQEKLNSAYAQANKRLNDLRKSYKELAVNGRENGKVARGLLQEITKLDSALKKIDATTGQYNRNVGNYKNSLKEAISESGVFGEQLGKLSEAYSLVKTATENTTGSTSKFGLALKGIGILSIITALKGLNDIYTKTAEGSDKLELATAKIGTRFESYARSLGASLEAGLNKKLAELSVFYNLLTGDSDALAKAQQEVIEATKAESAAMEDFIGKADRAVKTQEELTLATQKFRGELRKLNLQVQNAAILEENLKGINTDATLSLEQRSAAGKAATNQLRIRLALEKQIADKGVQFANLQLKKELELAGVTSDLNDNVINGLNDNVELRKKVNNASLDEQNKALLEQRRIADLINDIEGDVARGKREGLERALDVDISLIRSKKNSTTQLNDELQKQIDDERLQLDEREKIARQLLDIERNLTTEIIDRIRKTAQEEIKLSVDLTDAQKKENLIALEGLTEENLLLEGNSLKLREKILALKLSVGVQEQLSATIKKSQDIETKGIENLNKLAEEKIKLEQRLQEIILENRKTQAENTADKAKEESDRLVNLQSKTQETLLSDGNSFNQLMISQQKTLGEENKKLIDIEAKQRKEALINQLKLETDAIENSNKQFEEKEALKKKITKETSDAIAKIEKDASDKKNKQDIDDLLFFKELREKQIKDIAQQTSQLLDLVADASQKAADKRQEGLDKEVSERESNIERQQALAERGLANQLAFEKAELAKAELAREEQAKKEENRQELIAFFRLLSGYAETKPDTALAYALRDMALAQSAKVLFAATGAEAITGPGTETSDSIPAMLSKNESIITAAGTKSAPGLATAWNQGNLNGWFEENLLPKYMLDGGLNTGSTASNMANSAMLNQLVSVNQRLESLESTIKNKKETTFYLDNLGQVIEESVENGIKSRTLFKKNTLR